MSKSIDQWYDDLIVSGRVNTGNCKLCGDRFIVQFLYNTFGLCDECALRVVNAYSIAHSGRPHPDFDPNGYAAAVAHDKEKKARRYTKQPIPKPLRWEVMKRDDFRCKGCGSRDNLNADHVIPERKGGPTTLENLQTLCRSCNSRKGRR